MNKPTLANLYRLATRQGSTLPDVDTLVAVAHGERPADAESIVAEIAQSALQSDLLHFTRALEPASSALSADIAATFGARRAHTRGYAVPARAAAGRWRNVRRVGLGLTAALIAAVAMWSQHKPAPGLLANAAPASDRIFAAFDDRTAAKRQTDEIFNGAFRGDVIFRAD